MYGRPTTRNRDLRLILACCRFEGTVGEPMRRPPQFVMLLGLIVILGAGFWANTRWNPSTDHAQAIPVDFCWLLHNPDVVSTRPFMTSATIASAFPHGSILRNSSCPDRGVPFAERLVNQDHVSELEARFQENPYGSVRVSFEATLYRPSVLTRVWFKGKSLVGLEGDRNAPIIIRQFTAVGPLVQNVE